MKPYIIAAVLLTTGFAILGVLTANLIAPPEPKPQAHIPPPPRSSSGGGFSSIGGPLGVGGAATVSPAAPSYPATTPSTQSASRPATALLIPGMAPPMPSPSSAGTPGMPSMLPGGGGVPGGANPMSISAPSAIPVPHPSAIEATNSVPIIQPTDLGTAPTPTAGKSHQ